MAQATAGVRRLRKLQFNPEATPGTATDCDNMWRGTGILTDARVVEHADEDDGWMAMGHRQYTAAKTAELALEERDATFEELPWLLGGGIDWITTGGGDTTTGQYTFTYQFGTSGVQTNKTFTWEVGDNLLVETFNYGIVQDFNLSGAYGEPVRMSATIVGREITTKGAFYSTSVATPTVETIYFNKGSFYIDDKGTTAGTTEAPATLRDFSLDVVTGFVPVPAADGNIAWGHHKQVGYEISCAMTMELNGTAKEEKGHWWDSTPRRVRMKFEGTTLSETGSSYSNKTLIIDLVGKWESVDPIGDADGSDTLSATFRGYHDASAGDSQIIVVNDTQAYT